MNGGSHQALDSVDEFILVAKGITTLPILAHQEYREAAESLYQITQKVLLANENLARWLNRFLQFDFRVPGARGLFLALIGEYRTARSGGELRAMKFNCGEVRWIYDNKIAPRIGDLYPHDSRLGDQARLTFEALGNADDDMVAFIYDTVIGGIDAFLHDAEPAVDRSDLNSAEAKRLSFKVASAEMSERLERLAGGLSDLVLEYARLAQRPVTLA